MAVLLVVAVPGCRGLSSPGPSEEALSLLVEARREAERLPESPEREQLLGRLETLREVMTGQPSTEVARTVGAAQWYELFGPKRCAVSYFTKFADFDEDGRRDGVVARVRLEDRFGDPVKALGFFRLEAFRYVPHRIDKRGAQVGNWPVHVFTEDDVARYYDRQKESFRFPLQFADPVADDRIVVRATYYVPDGTGRKLFGRRTVKAGG